MARKMKGGGEKKRWSATAIFEGKVEEAQDFWEKMEQYRRTHPAVKKGSSSLVSRVLRARKETSLLTSRTQGTTVLHPGEGRGISPRALSDEGGGKRDLVLGVPSGKELSFQIGTKEKKSSYLPCG